MKPLRLALIGFGVVGQSVAEVLHTHSAQLAAQGLNAQIVAVSRLKPGSLSEVDALYDPDGLELPTLLEIGRRGSFDAYPARSGLVRGWDALRTIRESNADAVVEVSYTDLKTGEPAISHVRAAFESGKHATITNKGPVALAFRELSDLAKQKGLFFGYEGTVMSGTPSLRMARLALAGCTIREARGILNGTTNYILTQMENEMSYADALKEAQRLGYAEADPTGDVEGHDAAGKVVILANVVMGAALRVEDVDCTGISKITLEDVQSAHANGHRWKLIARATRTESGVKASVKPERLPFSDPLTGVSGATNAVTYDTDLLGPVTLIGAGAGGKETAFAILSDLIELGRRSIQ